jgi:hypothetical protein
LEREGRRGRGEGTGEERERRNRGRVRRNTYGGKFRLKFRLIEIE